VQSRAFAWNHGDFQNDIVQTWLGIVGPGVKNLGETGNLFTDHTDIRPTILSLTQLTDDYAHDGRVIFEIIADNALPVPLRGHTDTLTQLAEAYKQINAPTGPLGISTLTGISTQALAGDDPTDSTYSTLEAQIVNLTSQRNAIASQMIAMLENAAFNGQKIDEVAAKNLIAQAQALLNAVN
jgi:outer membrane murein-binding lipoprotein Lpp